MKRLGGIRVIATGGKGAIVGEWGRVVVEMVLVKTDAPSQREGAGS